MRAHYAWFDCVASVALPIRAAGIGFMPVAGDWTVPAAATSKSLWAIRYRRAAQRAIAFAPDVERAEFYFGR